MFHDDALGLAFLAVNTTLHLLMTHQTIDTACLARWKRAAYSDVPPCREREVEMRDEYVRR